MGIAPTVDGALRRAAVEFEVLTQPVEPGRTAGPIARHRLAKAVLLRDPHGHQPVVARTDKPLDDLYFQAGDRAHLVRMHRHGFAKLMADSESLALDER